jgi:hypothetical protein
MLPLSRQRAALRAAATGKKSNRLGQLFRAGFWHSAWAVRWCARATGRGAIRASLRAVARRARAQLVFRWKVANAQTQAVMADYYQLLLKGEGGRRPRVRRKRR